MIMDNDAIIINKFNECFSEIYCAIKMFKKPLKAEMRSHIKYIYVEKNTLYKTNGFQMVAVFNVGLEDGWYDSLIVSKLEIILKKLMIDDPFPEVKDIICLDDVTYTYCQCVDTNLRFILNEFLIDCSKFINSYNLISVNIIREPIVCVSSSNKIAYIKVVDDFLYVQCGVKE